MKLKSFIFCSLFFAIATTMYGQVNVINDSFFSISLNATRMVNVYLPQDYNQDSTEIRYPVVYFLHGATSDHTAYDFIIQIITRL